MTVPVESSKAIFTSTGVETHFIFPNTFQDPSDLVVTWGATGVENSYVLNVNYSVTGGLGAPGSIDLLTGAIAAGQKLQIRRSTPVRQLTDLFTGGTTNPDDIEKIGDRLTRICQELFDGATGAATFVHGNLGPQAEGIYHATAVYNGTAGFLSGSLRKTYDDHVASTANPHATTYTQVGAAPIGHVGTGGSEHPLAIAGGAAGFISGTDKAKLDGISASADISNQWIDDFEGPILKADTWARSTVATAPTSSILATPGGVYRELTDAGSATSAVTLRSTAKVTDSAWAPSVVMRIAHGAAGSIRTNVTTRWGLAADPSIIHGSDVDYAYFWWDGNTLRFVSRGGAGVEDSTVLAGFPNFLLNNYQIDVVSTAQIKAYINGVLVATHTKVPTSGVGLERFMNHVNNAIANARSMDMDYFKITETRS